MERIQENTLFKFCKTVFSTIWGFSKFYLLWIIIHFTVTHLYTYFCTPASLLGFIASPFMAITPHCKGFQWLFSISVNTIQQMWIVAGVWLTGKLTTMFQGVNDETNYSLRKRKVSQ